MYNFQDSYQRYFKKYLRPDIFSIFFSIVFTSLEFFKESLQEPHKKSYQIFPRINDFWVTLRIVGTASLENLTKSLKKDLDIFLTIKINPSRILKRVLWEKLESFLMESQKQII